MNNELLEKIEYLRERADISYDEALRLLEMNDGDIMGALIDLEKQGRMHGYSPEGARQGHHAHTGSDHVDEAKQKVDSFIKKACKTRIVVEKGSDDGDNMKTVANISAPLAAGVTVFAPYLTLAAGAFALVTGHQVRVKKGW